MASFGAHIYYRIVIDSTDTSGPSFWNISAITPLIGNEAVSDPLQQTTGNDRALAISGRELLSVVDKADIIFTSNSQVAEFTNTFFIGLGYPSGVVWDYNPVDIHGTIQLPTPQYLPLWYILGGSGTASSAPITGMSFYYSDNGVDFFLLKSFTNPSGIFGGSTENLLFILDETYDTKAVIGTSLLNRINLQHKYLTTANALDECYLTKAMDGASALPSSPETANNAYLGNVEWRLSGGVLNTDPDLSLGGIMSDTQINSQLFKTKGTIPGITLVKGSSNTLSLASITVVTDQYGRRWLDWESSGAVEGGSVEITHSGDYTLLSGAGTDGGYLCVTVDIVTLAEDGEYCICVGNSKEEILSDVPAVEAKAGSVVYKCLYFYNNHSMGAMDELFIYQKLDTHSDTLIEIGMDSAGIGGDAEVILDENTPPVSVVFSSPDKENPLVVGNIIAGQRVAVWIKRTIVQNTYKNIANDLSILAYGVSTI